MSLKELTSPHTATIYDLATTKDAMGGPVEAISGSGTSVSCRFTPLSRDEVFKWDSTGLAEMYLVMFPADPSLSLRKVLVWSSKVWKVRKYDNASEMGGMWRAVVQYDPRISLATP